MVHIWETRCPKATPEITLEVKSLLANFQRDYDWDSAVKLVAKSGDPSAESLPANDWYRLHRKLEIIKSTGLPPSAFPVPYDSFKEQAGSNSMDLNLGIFTNLGEKQKDLDYDFICFFLSTSRTDLYRSIDFWFFVYPIVSSFFVIRLKFHSTVNFRNG